mmetsp:Transcript_19488/g.50290  ORF Transcript_19488/g.50290 Transcript_19488/m.50290 type:complete len:387 (+) Transcript_19488:267-1427(+)
MLDVCVVMCVGDHCEPAVLCRLVVDLEVAVSNGDVEAVRVLDHGGHEDHRLATCPLDVPEGELIRARRCVEAWRAHRHAWECLRVWPHKCAQRPPAEVNAGRVERLGHLAHGLDRVEGQVLAVPHVAEARRVVCGVAPQGVAQVVGLECLHCRCERRLAVLEATFVVRLAVVHVERDAHLADERGRAAHVRLGLLRALAELVLAHRSHSALAQPRCARLHVERRPWHEAAEEERELIVPVWRVDDGTAKLLDVHLRERAQPEVGRRHLEEDEPIRVAGGAHIASVPLSKRQVALDAKVTCAEVIGAEEHGLAVALGPHAVRLPHALAPWQPRRAPPLVHELGRHREAGGDGAERVDGVPANAHGVARAEGHALEGRWHEIVLEWPA